MGGGARAEHRFHFEDEEGNDPNLDTENENKEARELERDVPKN